MSRRSRSRSPRRSGSRSGANSSREASSPTSGAKFEQAVFHIGRAYAIVLGAFGIAASVIALYTCQFFAYRSLDEQVWEGLSSPFNELVEASVGFFYYSEFYSGEPDARVSIMGYQCIAYDSWSDVSNNLFNAAQWCSVFAPTLALLGWAQIIFEMICCRLKGSTAIVSFLFFVASVLQGCTFMIFGDTQFCFEPTATNQCALRSGAWATIIATACYLVLGILASSLPPYPVYNEQGILLFTYGDDPVTDSDSELNEYGDYEGEEREYEEGQEYYEDDAYNNEPAWESVDQDGFLHVDGDTFEPLPADGSVPGGSKASHSRSA